MTTDNRGQYRRPDSLDDVLFDPDFLSHATATARKDARSTRLAVILEHARRLTADLSAAERPLDLLDLPFGAAASRAETFTVVSTLMFVPWAHADCSQKVMELQRTGELLRFGSTPMDAFYEAVALDARARVSQRQPRATVSLDDKKLAKALETYTRALTDWMRAVLASV